MKTCTAAYRSSDAAEGKQRQMWSSITSFLSLNSSISSFPHLCFLHSFSREAESLISIRISVCLIQFLLGFPGAQVRSGFVSICMEIGYSLGTQQGHTSTTAAHIRTYRGSAGGGDVCVCVSTERDDQIFLLTGSSSCRQVKKLANQF